MAFYRDMTCENVTLKGDKGTPIVAYVAKPEGPGPFPGVVLIHHLPGWSEFYIETTRLFAHHGYIAICANLYERAGQSNGSSTTITDTLAPRDFASANPFVTACSAKSDPSVGMRICRYMLHLSIV